jgi:hypothetical protein
MSISVSGRTVFDVGTGVEVGSGETSAEGVGPGEGDICKAACVGTGVGVVSGTSVGVFCRLSEAQATAAARSIMIVQMVVTVRLYISG